MEEAQSQAERWNIELDRTGMTNHAVIQMQESGLSDRKFLREWETREQHTKTWELMKQYFTDEFLSIQTYEPNKRNFESIQHNITESSSQEVSEFFEEFRRDAIVGSEQIQQMAQTFKGATETMSTVLERLKAAMEENATLTKTVAMLTATNKQLTDNNKTLAEALKALGAKGTPEGGGGWQKKYHHSNPKGDKCNICNKPHAKPFKDVCFELETNKEKRPVNWKSVL
jgi:DNA repair exonuclease SbcCD ATPase subunit